MSSGVENLAASTLLGFIGHGTRRLEVRRQPDGRVLLFARDAEGPVHRSLLSFDRTQLEELIRMLADAKHATPNAREAVERRRG